MKGGGRVRGSAPNVGWSVMKCARVWDGKWRRQQFLFLSFSDHSITLDLDPLTSETSSFKANVDRGS